MDQPTLMATWHVIAKSVVGATHSRKGLPNQDAYEHYCFDSLLPALLAVGDGHGSDKSFRSHLGSRLAVEEAIQVGREFVFSLSGESASRVKLEAERRLALNIVTRWKQRVNKHLQQRPFTQQELQDLAVQAGESAVDAVRRNPLLAYGTTLLAAFVTEKFIVYFQLGDGELLVAADPNAEISRPIARDESFIANETPSLCLDDAIKYARIEFKYIHDLLPTMIVLTTDGFPNSMPTDNSFLQFTSELREMLCKSGIEPVKDELPAWLEKATINGSGDDTTVVILYREEGAQSQQYPHSNDADEPMDAELVEPKVESGLSLDAPYRDKMEDMDPKALETREIEQDIQLEASPVIGTFSGNPIEENPDLSGESTADDERQASSPAEGDDCYSPASPDDEAFDDGNLPKTAKRTDPDEKRNGTGGRLPSGEY